MWHERHFVKKLLGRILNWPFCHRIPRSSFFILIEIVVFTCWNFSLMMFKSSTTLVKLFHKLKTWCYLESRSNSALSALKNFAQMFVITLNAFSESYKVSLRFAVESNGLTFRTFSCTIKAVCVGTDFLVFHSEFKHFRLITMHDAV